MKKSILDIYLVEMPILNNKNSQETIDNDEFGNWSKGLLVIYIISLGEALYNKSSFIMINGTIKVIFNFVYPFAAMGW